MKNYQDVVTNRFDKENDPGHSIYSPDHPTGKYIREVLYNGLEEFLVYYSKKNGALGSKNLLDIGCGDGGMLAYFISKGFSPHNVTGIDLSKTRIDRAKKQHPSVSFIQGDALSFNITQRRFDLITAFDLFSHLTTKDQIIRGLSNVHRHLEDNGLFLWYDIYSKDHFTPAKDADSWGFNKKQMMALSKEAGFEVVSYKSFFKNFFNRFHSIYQVHRLSAPVVKLLEMILPGMPGNAMLILGKAGNTGT